MPSRRFEKVLGTHDIRLNKYLGRHNRAVYMCFGRKVHEHINVRNEPINQIPIADVTLHESETIIEGHRCQVGAVTRIGQSIDDDNRRNIVTHSIGAHWVGA
jgi:hypothetical protein